MKTSDRIREALNAGPMNTAGLAGKLGGSAKKIGDLCNYLRNRGELRAKEGQWLLTGTVTTPRKSKRGRKSTPYSARVARKKPRAPFTTPDGRSIFRRTVVADDVFTAAANLLHAVVLEHVELEGVPILQAAIANFEAAKALREASA